MNKQVELAVENKNHNGVYYSATDNYRNLVQIEVI